MREQGLAHEACSCGASGGTRIGTEVEEIDVAAETGGRELSLPGFLLRTVRAFDT